MATSEGDRPTEKYVKRTLSNSRQSSIYVHKTYICKGGGSAYGGKWQPKKESDKKFIGEPNTTKTFQPESENGGYVTSVKYDSNGQASLIRHFTDHNKPWAHSNPHDHMVNWENGFPKVEEPINYPSGEIPDINKYFERINMNNNIQYFKYNPEENKFETLGEFKLYFNYCTELSFEYHGVEYGIDKLDDGLFYIGNCDERICIQEKLTLEQVLNFEIDGVKIRDFITTDDVEITDRPGPM